jgi:hypothetical protein
MAATARFAVMFIPAPSKAKNAGLDFTGMIYDHSCQSGSLVTRGNALGISGFYDQLGRMYASTASQCLHTKPAENQDSGTVSGRDSTLRTVSRVHVLQEAKSERASSHRTSPSVAGGPGGCAQAVAPASFTHRRNASRGCLQLDQDGR